MNIADKTLLITGGNRGIGLALVNEALLRGARRVYASTRSTMPISDPRIVPLAFDVTSATEVRDAAARIETLDLLINNAGVAIYDTLDDLEVAERHLQVNFLGALRVTQAMLPQLRASRGAVLNNLSLAGVAAVPLMASYSLSKAAALNMTQSLRALLAADGIAVHAALLGPIDTEMSRDLKIPKSSAPMAARGIFDGLELGEDDIFPDQASRGLADGWRAGIGKALERQFASFLPQPMQAAV